jgi:hypothetical protein
MGAHIGILCVHSSHQISEMMFLLIFIRDEKGIGLKVTLVDLEPGLVGNPDAIPESRGARMEISGHIMSTGRTRVERK